MWSPGATVIQLWLLGSYLAIAAAPLRRTISATTAVRTSYNFRMTTTTATTAEIGPQLPTPQERPAADVVIYDGHCRICTAQIQRIARWDKGGRLAFLSLHEPEVASRYPDLKHDDLMKAMVVVDRHGGRHWGAGALRQLSRRMPRLWPLMPLLHIPGSLPLWQWCYRQVASRRYALSGGMQCSDGSCRLH